MALRYQTFLLLCVQGLGYTTMFCGDGINDLAALSAADVGMAIGATDAVIAAELSTSHGSIAGEQTIAAWYCLALLVKAILVPFSTVHASKHVCQLDAADA